MQLLPKNKSLFALFRQAASITFVCIFKFSSKKVAGLMEFAWIPPTFAAARITMLGLLFSNHSLTNLVFKPLEILNIYNSIKYRKEIREYGLENFSMAEVIKSYPPILKNYYE